MGGVSKIEIGWNICECPELSANAEVTVTGHVQTEKPSPLERNKILAMAAGEG